MQITQITPAANQPKKDASTALQGLGNDLDTFLTMLTTQLKNQDPTNPLDTHQMTAQLVQFASVEQQIAQNKNLEDLVKLQNQNSEYAAVNYLGHNVQAEIDIADGSEDGASWGYVLDTPANTVDLHVVNSSGMRVYSTEGETGAGVRHSVEWDALDNNGNPVEPGRYKLLVIARDAQGSIIDGKPTIDSLGMVTAVKSNKTGPSLIVGQDTEVTLSQIKKIQ